MTVRGSAETRVFDGTRAASGASLRDGQIVDVDGPQRADYLYAGTITIKANDQSPAGRLTRRARRTATRSSRAR